MIDAKISQTSQRFQGGLPFMAKHMRFIRLTEYCGLLLVWLMLQHGVSAAEQPFYDLQGNQRSLAEFEGKWRLVNYWATWCTPCLEEIPELVRFHAQHKERDAVVIGINMEQLDAESLAIFMEELSINYPVWVSAPANQTPLGPLSGLPTSFLVSPRGEVVARQVGVVSAQMIEQFIERQAGSTQPAR